MYCTTQPHQAFDYILGSSLYYEHQSNGILSRVPLGTLDLFNQCPHANYSQRFQKKVAKSKKQVEFFLGSNFFSKFFSLVKAIYLYLLWDLLLSLFEDLLSFSECLLFFMWFLSSSILKIICKIHSNHIFERN